jgi:uncharacterized protein (DUF2141 family)
MSTDTTRFYSTRRSSIINALVDVLKEIDGDGKFHTNFLGMFILG